MTRPDIFLDFLLDDIKEAKRILLYREIMGEIS